MAKRTVQQITNELKAYAKASGREGKFNTGRVRVVATPFGECFCFVDGYVTTAAHAQQVMNLQGEIYNNR